MPTYRQADGSVIHISTPTGQTEWMDVPPDAGMVFADCCHCRMPAEQARFRKIEWYGGCEMSQRVECKPGFGCDANPRRRIGKWNRPHPEDYD
jgi:hypothetical protein